MLTNKKIPFLTDTVKKFTLINVSLLLIPILILNLILVYVTMFVLQQNLDIRITHEHENIKNALKISGSEIEITDYKEFSEPDLLEITENPYFIQIYNINGKVLISSDNIKLYQKIPIIIPQIIEEPFFESSKLQNDKLRTGYFPLKNESGKNIAVMQLSVFEKDHDIITGKVIFFNLISLPFILLIILGISVYTAKRSFKAINEIINTANQITAQQLSKRIDVKANPTDEIGRLRDTLNNLFERINSYVLELSNFTDQAAHQLMNPLTAIKTEIGYVLKMNRSVEEYKEALTQVHDQTDNMINIVSVLLIIAKSGKTNFETKKIFNFSKLINQDIKSLFKLHNINYRVEDNIYLRGNSEKFMMLVQNLIGNAIKFSIEQEEIEIILRKNSTDAELIVADTGIGILESEKEKVFQRFYRSIKSEELGIKGFGLGLSLVKSIVEEADGQVSIEDNDPKGTQIIIRIPYVQLSD